MVEIIEASLQGDVRMSLPVDEAVEYLKTKQNVYIYIDGEMVRASDVEIKLTSDDQRVDVTLPLKGGARQNITVPVDDSDAFEIADRKGGLWIYNTLKRNPIFAQVKKLIFAGADDENLYERRL